MRIVVEVLTKRVCCDFENCDTASLRSHSALLIPLLFPSQYYQILA